MNVNKATLRDIPRLVILCKKHFNESKFGVHNFNKDKAVLSLIEFKDSVNSIVYVVCAGETIIGYFVGFISESPVADYNFSCDEAFYVLPEYRNTYAGTMLVYEYVEWAKSKNIDYIMISNNTYEDSGKIDVFIRKQGFELSNKMYTYKGVE